MRSIRPSPSRSARTAQTEYHSRHFVSAASSMGASKSAAERRPEVTGLWMKMSRRAPHEVDEDVGETVLVEVADDGAAGPGVGLVDAACRERERREAIAGPGDRRDDHLLGPLVGVDDVVREPVAIEVGERAAPAQRGDPRTDARARGVCRPHVPRGEPARRAGQVVTDELVGARDGLLLLGRRRRRVPREDEGRGDHDGGDGPGCRVTVGLRLLTHDPPKAAILHQFTPDRNRYASSEAFSYRGS